MRIDTPRGPARIRLDHPAGAPAGLLMLGHGAGGGVETADLGAARTAGLGAGLTVAKVEQPYRVAGRRAPAPATQLDEAWTAVAAALREDARLQGLPLIAGGRSSGARVACRTASAVGAAGVLALAFPLHPPGKPERSRAAELIAVDVPVLVINGDHDPFGIPESSPGVTVRLAAGEAHSLDRDPATVGEWARRWLETLVSGSRGPRE